MYLNIWGNSSRAQADEKDSDEFFRAEVPSILTAEGLPHRRHNHELYAFCRLTFGRTRTDSRGTPS
eukprot:344824-Amorphochlora_amoeboformis.AAC.3